MYSVEKNPGAVDLLKKNREKFHLHNMHILEGDAMAQIPVLPMPEKVFIGGVRQTAFGYFKLHFKSGAGHKSRYSLCDCGNFRGSCEGI